MSDTTSTTGQATIRRVMRGVELVEIIRQPVTLDDLKERTFLTNYIDYTLALEPPEIFHIWSAYSIIAGALGRNISRYRGRWDTYPNLYVGIVSPSADTGKSTATSAASRLFSDTFTGDERYVVRGKCRPERLFADMGRLSKQTGESVVWMDADEMTSFFPKDIVKNSSYLDDLTQLYGCPTTFDNKFKHVDDDEIQKVCINILTTTTPETLQGCVGSDMKLGFIGRFAFCYDTQKRHCCPHPEDFMGRELSGMYVEAMRDQLRAIAAKRGEATYGPGAKQAYSDWYVKKGERLQYPAHMDGTGLLGRIGELVIKLAMISAADERPYEPGLLITKDNIEQAVRLAERSFHDACKIFAGVGRDRRVDNVRMAEVSVRQAGKDGISAMDLSRLMGEYVVYSEWEQIIKTLIKSGRVESRGDRLYIAGQL